MLNYVFKNYIFNPVVVNTYLNKYSDTWLMFNITKIIAIEYHNLIECQITYSIHLYLTHIQTDADTWLMFNITYILVCI